MLKRISGFHKTDFVADLPAHITDSSAISSVRNVRITNAKLARFLGSVSAGIALPSAPLYALAGATAGVPWWLIICDDAIISVSYGTVTDVTDALVITEGDGWVGESFNNVVVATNNAISPIMWDGGAAAASLTNWPPGDLTTSCLCGFIRGFKNFLIAGLLTEDGTLAPNVIRWSNQADPGTVPSTWDITDTANDAGRQLLAETSGPLVDGLAFGDVFFVYKSDATYMMTYIGGVFVFRITPLSLTSGMMAANCAANTTKGQVVLSQTDVVLVTPQGLVSIANDRIRNHLFNSVRATARERCFVAANAAMNEVWVCVPVNSNYPDRAYVWNYLNDKWTIRDLPNVTSITFGQAQTTGLIIEDAVELIEDALYLINSLSDALFQVFGTATTSSEILVFDRGNKENGASFTVEVIHHAYDFGDMARPEQAYSEKIKHITRLRPHFTPETAPGTKIGFQIGTQMEIGDAVSWSDTKVFTVGETRDLFFRANGRYISWKMLDSSAVQTQESYVNPCYWVEDYAENDAICNLDPYWELSGLDMTFQVGGVY